MLLLCEYKQLFLHFGREAVEVSRKVLIHAYERHVASLPRGAARPDPPSEKDAFRAAWRSYRKARWRSRLIEYIVTFISLGSYGWAVAAGVSGPHCVCVRRGGGAG